MSYWAQYRRVLVLGTVLAVLFELRGSACVNDHKQLAAEKFKGQKRGLSVLPVIAGNSTYGIMVGGAVFFHQPVFCEQYLKSQVMTVVSQNSQMFLGIQANFKDDRWIRGIKMSFTDFFDSYYEGSREVRQEAPDQISAFEAKYEAYSAFRHNKVLSTKIIWEQRQRTDHERLFRVKENRTDKVRIFPDERTIALGIATTFDDTTETELSPVGHRHVLSWRVMPGGEMFTNMDGQPRFVQLGADARYYVALMDELVLASRAFYGKSIGTPSYLYRYRLGGGTLRGYRYSRFKGNTMYSVQEEARFPIWSVVTGSLFVGMGDVTDDTFGKPFHSYGFSIKIGLPPDYVAKVRFDVGFSEEPTNFIMQANHAF